MLFLRTLSFGLLALGLALIVTSAQATWDYVPTGQSPSLSGTTSLSPGYASRPVEKPAPRPAETTSPSTSSEVIPPSAPISLVHTGPALAKTKHHHVKKAATCSRTKPSESDVAKIADAQMMLAILGYDPGGFDGLWSSKTQKAARAYEASSHLSVENCLTDSLLQHMHQSVDKGRPLPSHAQADVLAAQISLIRLGYYLGAADGHLGSRTKSAISDFQTSHNLAVTGQVDSTLLQALQDALKTRTSAP